MTYIREIADVIQEAVDSTVAEDWLIMDRKSNFKDDVRGEVEECES